MLVLNPDCIRDLMLFFEEKTGTRLSNDTGGRFNELEVNMLERNCSLSKYSKDEIKYHIIQLSESNYIITDFKFAPFNEFGIFSLSKIYYITPKGHEFITSIKKNETWEKILKYLEPLGSISLKVIEAAAQGATTAFISNLRF